LIGEVDVERESLRRNPESDTVGKGDIKAKERQEEREQTLQAYKAIMPSLREITVFMLFVLLILWMMFAKLHGCDIFHLSCLKEWPLISSTLTPFDIILHVATCNSR
jgi:hypothetical protein